MKEKIRKALIRGDFLQRVIRKIDYYIAFCFRKLFYRNNSVVNNRIFFATYDGKYSCNLKYICDEILAQQLPLELIWVREKGVKASRFPAGVKTVVKGSYNHFEAMGTSKIWIDNALNCVWHGMPKKNSQVYINTWHGSMGIKRLSGNWMWRHRAKRCRKATDYCISNSVFEEDVYRDTFWPESEYLRYGHARNDVLLQPEKHPEVKGKVHRFFGIQNDVNIALYAPTFRDDGSIDCYNIDFAQLKQELESRFGGTWVILVRMHHKNAGVQLSDHWNSWLINASAYPDMQELMIAIDFGITDYSSWAYDYVLLKKPMLIYAADVEKYDGLRGFYYSLYDTPFPVCRNNDDVKAAVETFDEEQYLKKCDEFLLEKGCGETGRSAKLTVELIKKITGVEAPQEKLELPEEVKTVTPTAHRRKCAHKGSRSRGSYRNANYHSRKYRSEHSM